MKRLVSIAILFLLLSAGLHAQGFTISLSPEHQRVEPNQATSFTVDIIPHGGFSATVSLTLISPRIWIPEHHYPKKVNAPYTQFKIDVPTPYSALGTNMIIVEGKNGTVVSRDTCYIELQPGPRSRGWRYFTPGSSPNPDNNIWLFTVGPDGTGWVMNSKGLGRVDANGWEQIPKTFTGNGSAMAVDSNGTVLVGSGSTIFRYRDGTWNTLTLPQGLSSITGITVKGNDLWVAASGGVARWDGSAWTAYTKDNSELPGPSVTHVEVDRAGTIWVLSNNMLARFDGQFWTTYLAEELNLGFSNTGRYGTNLLRDIEGNVWMVSDVGPALVQLDATKPAKEWKRQSLATGESGTNQALDARNNLWTGTRGQGLRMYDGAAWTIYTMANSGLPDNHIQRVKISPTGTIWVGTVSSGLAIYDPLIAAGLEPPAHRTGTSGLALAAHPNPATGMTLARISVPNRTQGRLALYNSRGEEVAMILDGTIEAGQQDIPFDAAGLPNGVYFLRLAAGGALESAPVVVAR